VYGFGQTLYGTGAGTFDTEISRWVPGATTPAASTAVGGVNPFVIERFAASRDGKYMYACGSLGQTSKKARFPHTRKRVAIRRIKLG
jgi:hypothetical protein